MKRPKKPDIGERVLVQRAFAETVTGTVVEHLSTQFVYEYSLHGAITKGICRYDGTWELFPGGVS